MTAVADGTDVAVPEVERQLAQDMVRRGLPVAPVVVAAGAIGWGLHGALSAGY
ncbi:MAG: hypothetical protein JWO77_3572, partial [Ilumatobacteraceae bacterium]|nr:hypothetical protein [Ilumatobacteraceae bacterium]